MTVHRSTLADDGANQRAETQLEQHRRRADEHATAGRRAVSTHALQIQAIGYLFGDATSQVLTRSFEDVTENLAEETWHRTQIEGHLAARVEELTAKHADLVERWIEARAVAYAALDQLVANYDRARRPLPDNVEALLVRVQHPCARDEESPF